MKQTIYLDYAAATPLDMAVLAAMQPYFTHEFYNPSATYAAAQTVKKTITDARATIAGVMGVKSSEIIFTAGGTEANNLAIHGIMQRFPEAEIITSAIEHESVLAPARQYHHKTTPVTPDGRVDSRALERVITDKTVLISIMYANNEIGTIQPLAEIAALIKQIRHKRVLAGNPLPLYFHTDACQAANFLHVYANGLGVDLMTLNAGKIYGPKQCGLLFVRAGVELKPLIDGGGQERGLRSGTENVAQIVGFAAALERAQAMRNQEAARLQKLQNLFVDALTKQIPTAHITGKLTYRLPNNIHVIIPGQDNERLIYALDEQGVQCAAGSACSASKEEASHVLKALGLSDEAARASLRFTMGRQTTGADIEKTVKILSILVA